MKKTPKKKTIFTLAFSFLLLLAANNCLACHENVMISDGYYPAYTYNQRPYYGNGYASYYDNYYGNGYYHSGYYGYNEGRERLRNSWQIPNQGPYVYDREREIRRNLRQVPFLDSDTPEARLQQRMFIENILGI